MSLSRRTFLTLTAMTGTQLALNSLSALAKPLASSSSPNYKLLVMATNWGFNGGWDEFCSRAKEAGYDGAEVWFPSDENEVSKMNNAFQKHRLKPAYLFGGSDTDPQKHLDQFALLLERAVKSSPVYINCHSGRDYFTFEQNKKFIDLTTKLSRSSGIPIYHETHRGRSLYSAPITRQYIEKLPDLRITFDVSHWCNVHESLLQDQKETLDKTLERVDHIHARIGHPEGPQVNDPRAPEWKEVVEAHFAWWDKVVARKRLKGEQMTFLTEFGPVDYMPALPYTRQPLANQWEINKYMMTILRERYS